MRAGRTLHYSGRVTKDVSHLSNLDIARAATLQPLDEVVAPFGIAPEHLIPYGRKLAKVDMAALDDLADRPQGKYVVVTAMTPTPLGEGKTTTSVGLAQALNRLGANAMLTLRQPSMGPTFGIKGGAAGAGLSQVVPMEELNLHLTGDAHAITAAHNLLAAMVDNHLFQGNKLGIDERTISWRRVLDVNDRSLRNIVIGLGGRIDGVTRQAGFDITAASEVGVILALATSLADLRERLGRIVVGYTHEGHPVTAEDLKAAGAMAVIMKDAINPNLLQTLEHTPVLVHAGPFGNIATGNSSILADLIAVRAADIVLTEAGFGSDMGAERFFNIKCRVSGLRPAAAVIVATVRALKAHSGRFRIVAGKPLPEALLAENPDDVRAGLPNLAKHIDIVKGFGVPPVVAINAFPGDHDSEHEVIKELCAALGVRCAVSRHVAQGGAGAIALAQELLDAFNEPIAHRNSYELNEPLRDKMIAVAREVYGAQDVTINPVAARDIDKFEKLGYGHLPVVMAKTHLSISADKTLLGAPTGWILPIREVRLAAGAGYVYAICGDMSTMPGLSGHPAAEHIDIGDDGEVVGLS